MSETRITNSGRPPMDGLDKSVPDTTRREDGQYKDHWILSDNERAKGFVRPVRQSYRHEKCGTVTSMPVKIAETYAREPQFYGSTFCCGCGDYFRVGAAGQFVWLDDASKVGT